MALATLSFKFNVIFSFSTLLYFNNINHSSLLALLWGVIDICTRGLFRAKFNSEKLLFEAFLLRCVFLAALSPKFKVIFSFSIILYFDNINLSRPLSPLWEVIDICACGLFWAKFNSEKLLFEAFFAAMRIFGSVEP